MAAVVGQKNAALIMALALVALFVSSMTIGHLWLVVFCGVLAYVIALIAAEILWHRKYYKLMFNPKPLHSSVPPILDSKSSSSAQSLSTVTSESKPSRTQGPAPTQIEGYCHPDFEAVRQRFALNWLELDEVGAGLTVYLDGKVIVDIWGGWEDACATRPWQQDTLAPVFSSGKSVECLCIGKLVTEGKLNYDRPVADYWPQFAQNGKQAITVGQLMRHEAGLLSVDDARYDSVDFLLESQTDKEKQKQLDDILAAQAPLWNPASGVHGYHALSRGFYVNQLIRHVDGRSLSTYFNEEIAAPLGGLDFYYVLPEQHHKRVADLVGRPMLWSILESLHPLIADFSNFWARNFYMRMLDSKSCSSKAFSSPAHLNAVRYLPHYNSSRIYALEASSSAGCASAKALAAIHNVLAMGGTTTNTASEGETGKDKTIKFISTHQLEEEAKQRPKSMDEVLCVPTSFSRGGWLQPDFEHSKEIILGCGFGGSIAFADIKRRLSFAYVPNMMGEMDGAQPWLDKRAMRIVEVLYHCLDTLPPRPS